MRFIIVAVILYVGFSSVCGKPSEPEANADIVDTNPETQEAEESDQQTVSVKTKRGILNYGYGHGHVHAHAHPHTHSHVHGVSYALPSSYSIGLHRHQHATPYARFPGVYRSAYSPTGHVALSHGGASVNSYSATYPRVPIVATRPLVHHHHVAVARPHLVPLPHVAPIAPPPSVILPQRPIIPVAYPTYAHRVPVYVQRPIQPVVFQRPVTPFVVQKPAVSAVAPLPLVPTAPIGHVHPFAHNPHIYNSVAFGGLQPQFIPIPVSGHAPSIPTTINTPLVPEAIPQPGSTIFTNAQPNGWRPIIVTAPLPTVPTSSINRPNVSLLPPYLEQSPSTPQGEVQPSVEEPVHTPQPQTPSTLYLSPSEVNQLENAQDLANSHAQYHLQQQHQQQQIQQIESQQLQQQLQSLHEQEIQHQQHSHQNYEPASNQGRYSGPSSYDVQLGSRTRLY